MMIREMTEGEICREYRLAKDKGEQIQILADRNCTSRAEIIGILTRGGERVRIMLPSRGKKRMRELSDKEYYQALFKRLDILDAQIAAREREYREIVAAIRGRQNEAVNDIR